jgi:serine/threonine protein kinase
MLEAQQVINERYQLQEKLGRNTGRQTWLAKDLSTETQQLVVVKLLAFGGDVQWEDLKLFEREAQTLQQLDHARIPKYQDYFSIDERTLWFGLVQEYIPGSSLKKLLEQGTRFSESEAKQTAQKILQILIYLHGLNPPLLHRDIKPSNLIFGEDKNIYLVDFGAVQDCAATEGATFTVVGTYGYAPMEQFGGKAVPASDLYALGATLIHLLTRTSPGDLPTTDLKLQFRDRITLSYDFAKWLDKMLYPAVEKRFSTAQQALDCLIANPANSSFVERKVISNCPSLEKPIYSKVEVERYPNLLEIIIPPQSNNLSDFLGNFENPVILGILFLISPILFISFPILFIAALAIYFYSLKSKILKTKLSLGYHRFQIITHILGFQKQQIGLTQNIQDISINYVTSSQGTGILKTDAIIINTKSISKFHHNERFIFGKGLKEEELLWLVSEIRNWLASKQ